MLEKIRIEATSACQLKCPSCPTASGAILPNIGNGYLRLENFREFLEQNQSIKVVELSNYGEIFLNPDLLQIFALADERGIELSAGNGVNLNNVRPEVLEGLVKYKIKSLNCSIDGASNPVYQQYRIGGDLETVIKNIETINAYKQQYASEFPILYWQFILFGHNQHEILQAKSMAESLDMKFYAKLSWDEEFSPWSADIAQKIFGTASRQEFSRATGKDYMQKLCHQLWDMPQINWDGKLLGCCRNFWGDFGDNVFEHGLSKALNSEKMNYAKSMLQGQQVQRDDIPCSSCEIYTTMQKNKQWLKR